MRRLLDGMGSGSHGAGYWHPKGRMCQSIGVPLMIEGNDIPELLLKANLLCFPRLGTSNHTSFEDCLLGNSEGCFQSFPDILSRAGVSLNAATLASSNVLRFKRLSPSFTSRGAI